MSGWTTACLALAVVFGLVAIIFALLREKGTMLLSGFNTLPKEEKEKYNRKQLALDTRNSLLLWFSVLLLGAVLSYYFGNIFAIIALFVWIILFIKDFHYDLDKAYGKYKK